MQKIAILGFGREGKAIFHYFSRKGNLISDQIYILTSKKDSDATGLDNANLNVFALSGENYLANLSDYDLICRSPGIPLNLPEIQAAIKAGKKITSATKLFFEALDSLEGNKPITIGVTGTKGKGTVTTIIYEILKRDHKRVALVGNIGKPALDILSDAPNLEFIIVELSSFQLHDLAISPTIAVVLDITPDHLDAHKNFKEYRNAKNNIARYQTTTDTIFYPNNSKTAKAIARRSAGHKIAIELDKFKLFTSSQVKIPGAHTFENAIIAATVAEYLKINPKIIRLAVNEFTGLPHRLEQVHNKKYLDIQFFNDSYSTNPESTAAAVGAFSDPLILIAGGKDKGLKYKILAKSLKKSSTERIILFGENRKKMESAISKKWKGEIEFAKNLQSAILLAINHAKRIHLSHSQVGLKTNKVVILFSPGASSFDMFTDASHRGEEFKKLVKNL